MKIEDIENLTREALIKKVTAIYSQEGIIESFFMTEELLMETAKKMKAFQKKIDFTSEDAKDHMNIISIYMKNVLMWTENQNKLRQSIDEDMMKAAREKRLAASRGSLEDRINKRSNKKKTKK